MRSISPRPRQPGQGFSPSFPSSSQFFRRSWNSRSPLAAAALSFRAFLQSWRYGARVFQGRRRSAPGQWFQCPGAGQCCRLRGSRSDLQSIGPHERWRLLPGYWQRNWFPSPSPLAGAFYQSCDVDELDDSRCYFFGTCRNLPSCCRRLSGTGTMPTFGSMVQNG